MSLTKFDDLIRESNSPSGPYEFTVPFYLQTQTAGTSTMITGQLNSLYLYQTPLKSLPSLPSGKSYFAVTHFCIDSSVARDVFLVKLTSFGSIDISGASGTFTDGSQAPTVTEGGTSRQIPGSVLMSVSTALNATPGTMTFTYKDQDNNAAETTASHTLTASAAIGTSCYGILNAGDWGAVDLTAAARSAGTTPSGTIRFYHVTPIASEMCGVAAFNKDNSPISEINLVKLAAGDQLYILQTLTTAAAIQGSVTYMAL